MREERDRRFEPRGSREAGSRDRGYRDPSERPYARDRERRTEFRGPELDDSTGYASRYPAEPPEPGYARDEADERFEGFGEERPEDHPGYGRTERFGSEAAGYGRERLAAGGEHDDERAAEREHERRRREHEGRGYDGRSGSRDAADARHREAAREDETERVPHSYEEQQRAPKGHPSYGGARSYGGYGGFGGGGYPERRTDEGGPWQQGERASIGFPQQGRGTAHPGSSRWAEGGRWDPETESVEEDYSRRSRPYGGRPSERVDEWARGSSGRPSGGYAGRGPKTYRRSDERIREDVCECLTRAADIDATDVDIDVKDGEVRLRGCVETREMKRRAEDVTLECAGVKDVVNELRVGSPD